MNSDGNRYYEELARLEKLDESALLACSDACLLVLKPFVAAFASRNGLEVTAGWHKLAAALEIGVSHAPMAATDFLGSFDRIMFDADHFDGWYDEFTQDALLGMRDGLEYISNRTKPPFDSLCATVVNVIFGLDESSPSQINTGSILADLARGDLKAAQDFAERVNEALYAS